MSSIQPTLPTALDLKPTFGWGFIGVVFASIFYGITVVQTLFYYQTYPNDRNSLKILVLCIWILDTLSLAMVSHGAYNWLVIDFSNPIALNDVLWSIFVCAIFQSLCLSLADNYPNFTNSKAEPLCAASIALCVHWSMAYRIYKFEPKLVPLVISIAVVSLVPFTVGIVAVVLGLTTPGGFGAVNIKLHSITIVAIVFTASLDIVIAGTLVTLVRRRTSTFTHLHRTDKMLSTLTMYLLANNLLTSLITTTLLITFFAAPKELVYEAFNVVISKVYTNAFLSQLNARDVIRGKGTISTQISTNVQAKMEPIAFHISRLSNSHQTSNVGELDTREATVLPSAGSEHDMNMTWPGEKTSQHEIDSKRGETNL